MFRQAIENEPYARDLAARRATLEKSRAARAERELAAHLDALVSESVRRALLSDLIESGELEPGERDYREHSRRLAALRALPEPEPVPPAEQPAPVRERLSALPAAKRKREYRERKRAELSELAELSPLDWLRRQEPEHEIRPGSRGEPMRRGRVEGITLCPRRTITGHGLTDSALRAGVQGCGLADCPACALELAANTLRAAFAAWSVSERAWWRMIGPEMRARDMPPRSRWYLAAGGGRLLLAPGRRSPGEGWELCSPSWQAVAVAAVLDQPVDPGLGPSGRRLRYTGGRSRKRGEQPAEQRPTRKWYRLPWELRQPESWPEVDSAIRAALAGCADSAGVEWRRTARGYVSGLDDLAERPESHAAIQGLLGPWDVSARLQAAVRRSQNETAALARRDRQAEAESLWRPKI
jgi:hypothetical protein